MNKKPNIIVFFTDQQRWDTSGLCGNTMGITPNYDRMAIEGTHCYYGFTPQPVCLPARSTMQTGEYASCLNIYNNEGELPQDRITLGQLFESAGYHTGYIGKWHMCHQEPVPKELRKGYDYWLGANLLEFSSDAYKTMLYDDEGNEKYFPGYRVDAITDRAIEYIDRNKDAPFFLFMSFLEPHFQNTRDDYPAPYGYEEKYADSWTPPDLRALGGTSARHLPGYYGMVKRLDEALGRLNDALISLEIKEDTIILFTSDHGCHFKTRNREYKRSCHDASIRVPMMFTGSVFTGGGRVNEMTSLIDIPPTLLDACGIEKPENMQGSSIIPLVKKQETEWPDYVYSEICCDDELFLTIRTKRWKYCIKDDLLFSETSGHSISFEEHMLYDLKADPWELDNLIGSMPHREVCEMLKYKLQKHLEKIGHEAICIRDAKEILRPQLRLD